MTAHLARSTADLKVTLADIDTAWMLEPALHPLLGGHLRGNLSARVRLAPTLSGIDAQISRKGTCASIGDTQSANLAFSSFTSVTANSHQMVPKYFMALSEPCD